MVEKKLYGVKKERKKQSYWPDENQRQRFKAVAALRNEHIGSTAIDEAIRLYIERYGGGI